MVFFIGGIMRVILAFTIKPIKGWGWMVTGGIVSVLFACMVGWEFPASSLWVVGTMVGVSLIFNGVTTITLAGAARQIAGGIAKAI